MPKYRVAGTDESSGFETDLVIEAESEAGAKKIAQGKKIRVGSCVPVDASAAVVTPAAATPIKPTRPLAIPGYRGLHIIASLLMGLGGAVGIIGALLVGFGLVGAFNSNSPSAVDIMVVPGLIALGTGVGWFIAGELLSAFRDITINSWYVRAAVESRP